tara:strand:+ start:1806 stop:2294 length:489 start_codon:yes stop_codon:yes gene_type:complete
MGIQPISRKMKNLKCYAAIHMPFEAVLVALGTMTTWYGGTFPILPLVGSSVLVCCGNCCCTSKGGKGAAVTYLTMNCIAFLGSVWDYIALSHVKAHCDEIGDWVEVDEYCNYVDAASAFAIICFIMRIIGTIMASCSVCCLSPEKEPETITEAPVADVMESK